MFTPTFIALILCVILTLTNSLISKQSIFDREKTSPFECGFDPKTKSRLPFSLRFYLIALVFLIFDVEITLILPMPVIFQWSLQTPLLMLTVFFIIILLGGLFHEWNQGALDWDR